MHGEDDFLLTPSQKVLMLAHQKAFFIEPLSKCSILFEVKKGENFHLLTNPDHRGRRDRAKRGVL